MIKSKLHLNTYSPMHRGRQQGELNSAVVFLAAEESSFVNGAILPVDGGMTCI
ncbi:SDR family NAD(P)-dependent oxidoreductase [Clostridium sp. AF15-17LB]|nr:SDR family NAD(P)-dependent oxidoreductase [Clostridium sp. AF15-17LB]